MKLRCITAIALMFTTWGVSAHPLDGLAPEEIKEAVSLLKQNGAADDDAQFSLIELQEPDKQKVLAWKEGDSLPRMVMLHFRNGDETREAHVDLTADKVMSVDPIDGQPMLLLSEFLSAMDTVLDDEAFAEALAKRDLTPEEVFCLPLTGGNFPDGPNGGQRIMKVPCYVSPEGSNFYAKPIEGLVGVVDLHKNELIEIIDNQVYPVPEDPWGYTEDELAERATLRDSAQQAKLTAGDAGNVSVEGSEISWDIWKMRYRVDKRPGVVLSDIQVNDQGTWREVMYQAHLSEVFVPYMDPSDGWYWRTYMDSGEYGFGLFLTPLRKQVDCPAYATFLPAVVHDDAGDPLEIPDALCVFERNVGDPAWRHYEIFAQGPNTTTPAEGRPATELVIRSASEVGNYDYLIDYVFHQHGGMDINVLSTGLDAVKGAVSKSMADETAAEETQHGTLIAPNLVAPNHDHYFNFRMDFDVDGQDNTFMRTGLVPGKPEKGAKRRSFWETETVAAKTEMDARYRVNPATPAMYHVMNTNEESHLGHKPGYMIDPNNAVAYGQFDFENDPPMHRNAYISHTFWTTPYKADERYAGGKFAMASDGSDTLARWVEQDRPIENTDIVTWFTMGFHHVPRMEDWPVMSTMSKGIRIRPFNFFGYNPAATLRLDSEAQQ